MIRRIALALVLLVAGAAATPTAKAGMIQMNANHKKLAGYLALPAGKGTHPAIIAVHEWWGVNDWVKEQADSLAAHGYIVFAVDLYGGRVAHDSETAHQYMSGLGGDEAVATLRRGVDFLRSRSDVRAQAIGVIGWCMGGGYAIRLAAADPGIRACVMYYGAPISDPAAIRAIRASVLGNFGGDDEGPTPAQVRTFEGALRSAGKSVDFKIYPGAGHAFANVNNPWGGYREQAAKDAWSRTLAFLDKDLRKASLPKRRKV